MSEQHNSKHEVGKSHELGGEHNKQLQEIHRQKAEQARKAHEHDTTHQRLETAREAAEKHAESAKTVSDEATTSELSTAWTHQLLKKDAYKQVLRQAQSKLSKPKKAFSKVIHNKQVESISNVGAQTVARPSGILGGGIGAFSGSLLLFFLSRHYGFTYNYGVVLSLFVGGFFAGLIIEMIVRAIRKKD